MKFGVSIDALKNLDAAQLIRSCREAGVTVVRLAYEVIPDDVRKALVETKMSVYYVPIPATEAAVAPGFAWLGQVPVLEKFYREFCDGVVSKERTIGIALPEALENVIKLGRSGAGWPREQVRLVVDRLSKIINEAGFTSVLQATHGAVVAGDWRNLSFGAYDVAGTIVGDAKLVEAVARDGKRLWFGTALCLSDNASSPHKDKAVRSAAAVKVGAEYAFINSQSPVDFAILGGTIRDINSSRELAGDKNVADWKAAKRAR